MIKSQELADPGSCLNRAGHDEMVFVLLGRDAAAPIAIRAWVHERLALGKNAAGDAATTSALVCADYMERQRAEWIAAAMEESQAYRRKDAS